MLKKTFIFMALVITLLTPLACATGGTWSIDYLEKGYKLIYEPQTTLETKICMYVEGKSSDSLYILDDSKQIDTVIGKTGYIGEKPTFTTYCYKNTDHTTIRFEDHATLTFESDQRDEYVSLLSNTPTCLNCVSDYRVCNIKPEAIKGSFGITWTNRYGQDITDNLDRYVKIQPNTIKLKGSEAYKETRPVYDWVTHNAYCIDEPTQEIDKNGTIQSATCCSLAELAKTNESDSCVTYTNVQSVKFDKLWTIAYELYEQTGTTEVELTRDTWTDYGYNTFDALFKLANEGECFDIRLNGNVIMGHAVDSILSIAGFIFPEWAWWASPVYTYKRSLTNPEAAIALPINGTSSSTINGTSGVYMYYAGTAEADNLSLYYNTSSLYAVVENDSSETWSAKTAPLEEGVSASTATSNLVAHYTLDEPSGTVAEDSANGYNGTYTNTPTLGVDSIIINGTDFDGATDEQVLLTGEVANVVFNAPFSISMWFNSDVATSSTGMLYNVMDSGTSRFLISYGHWTGDIADEKICVDLYDGAQDLDCYRGSLIAQNTWHHLVVSGDGTDWFMFIDGVDVSDELWHKNANGNRGDYGDQFVEAEVYIGVRDGTLNDFDGTIDDFKIFNSSITQAQVSQLYLDGLGVKVEGTMPSDGPIIHMPLDNDNNTVLDVSGNGYTFTPVNTPTLGATGKINKAYDFTEGNSEYAVHDTDLNLGEYYSLSAWVKPESMSGDPNYIFSYTTNTKAVTTEVAIMLYFYYSAGGDLAAYARDVSSDIALCTADSSSGYLNNWNHIVFVRDDNMVLAYVNGSEVCNASDPDLGTITQERLVLGAFYHDFNNAYSSYFDGKIDDVQIYNRSLSEDEILWLYNLSTTLGNETTNTSGDTTPPELSWNWTDINSTINVDNSYICVNASEAVNCTLHFNGTDIANATSGTNICWNRTSLSEGNYSTINASCDDASSNSNTTTNAWLDVDTQAPQIDFVSPTLANNSYTTSPYFFNATINETNLDTLNITFGSEFFEIYSDDLLYFFNWNEVAALGESYGDGGTAKDLSPNGNDATLSNDAEMNTSGKYGNCIHFNESNDSQAVIAKSDSMNYTGSNISFGSWVYLYTNEYNVSMVIEEVNLTSLAIGHLLAIDIGGILGTVSAICGGAYFNVTETDYYCASATLTELTPGIYGWHHIVTTIDTEYIRIYHNGVEIGNYPTAGEHVVAQAADTYFGYYVGYGATHTDLRIDDTFLMKRSLTAEEVQLMYESTLTKHANDLWTLGVNKTFDEGTQEYYIAANDSSNQDNESEHRFINQFLGTATPSISIPSTGYTGVPFNVEWNISMGSNYVQNLTYNISSSPVGCTVYSGSDSGFYSNNTSTITATPQFRCNDSITYTLRLDVEYYNNSGVQTDYATDSLNIEVKVSGDSPGGGGPSTGKVLYDFNLIPQQITFNTMSATTKTFYISVNNTGEPFIGKFYTDSEFVEQWCKLGDPRYNQFNYPKGLTHDIQFLCEIPPLSANYTMVERICLQAGESVNCTTVTMQYGIDNSNEVMSTLDVIWPYIVLTFIAIAVIAIGLRGKRKK